MAEAMRQQEDVLQEIRDTAEEARSMASQSKQNYAMNYYARECIHDSQHALTRYARLCGPVEGWVPSGLDRRCSWHGFNVPLLMLFFFCITTQHFALSRPSKDALLVQILLWVLNFTVRISVFCLVDTCSHMGMRRSLPVGDLTLQSVHCPTRLNSVGSEGLESYSSFGHFEHQIARMNIGFPTWTFTNEWTFLNIVNIQVSWTSCTFFKHFWT